MKKVLIVITTGFDSVGGITSAVMNYIRNITEKNINFDFCSFNYPNFELIKEINSYGYFYYKLVNRKKNVFLYCYQLYKLIKNNKYDIIHIHGNSSTMIFELLVAKFCNIKKRIVHVHSKSTNYPIINKILSPIFNNLYTDAIAVSKDSGNWLYNNKSFVVLNNAINIEKYRYNLLKRNRIRTEFNIKENCKVIGNVSKLNPGKNLFFLIDVYEEYFKINPNSKLFLVGGGSLYNQLKKYVNSKNLQDNVILTGMRMDIDACMSAMDYFVFTSLHEGLGMVLIEAQTAGLYCICSNKVPLETKVTDNIEYLGLEEPISKWVLKINSISKHNRISNKIYNDIRKNGYDIKIEADKLINIYL